MLTSRVRFDARSRAGVGMQVYPPTDSGRLRVQNDIKEKNANRRDSADQHK